MFGTSAWIIAKSLLIYFIVALILAIIPVNTNFRSNPSGYKIFVVSNGVHTDIVLPVNSGGYSWQAFFKHTAFRDKIQYANYVAFGWGNKLFYLNTPEWKDLTLSIAVKALFIKTEPAMHVTLVGKVHMGNNVRSVFISEKELNLLVKYILSSFSLDNSGKPASIQPTGYGPDDLFFKARGKFTLFKPCNEWTNEGLRKAGIRCVAWSPFDKPILWALSRAEKK